LLQWTVDIQRSACEPLGIALDLPESTTVRHVSSDSAAGKWNRLHAERDIQQGDRLVEVNGHRSTPGIARACQESHVLRMVFARESDVGWAERMAQDVIRTGVSCALSDDGDAENELEARLVLVPDENNSELGAAAPVPNVSPALARSPYKLSAVTPRQQSKIKRRARPAGFRSCCIAPPEIEEVLLPTPIGLPRHPPAPAGSSSVASASQGTNVPKAQLDGMPGWLLREAAEVRMQIKQAEAFEASIGKVEVSPSPPSWSWPRQPSAPPLPGSFGNSSVKRPGHFNMYGRPSEHCKQRSLQRHLPRGHADSAPPRLSEEESTLAWRKTLVSNVMTMAKASQIPLGMLPRKRLLEPLE
jgi:hypothetical protein